REAQLATQGATTPLGRCKRPQKALVSVTTLRGKEGRLRARKDSRGSRRHGGQEGGCSPGANHGETDPREAPAQDPRRVWKAGTRAARAARGQVFSSEAVPNETKRRQSSGPLAGRFGLLRDRGRERCAAPVRVSLRPAPGHRREPPAPRAFAPHVLLLGDAGHRSL